MSARTKIAAAALLIALLLALAWMTLIAGPDAAPEPASPSVSASASGGGITLVSDSIALPRENVELAPLTERLTATCTACHSAEMLATQPRLTPEKWQATINKMREVYKAPIDPAEDAALIADLTTMPQQVPPPTSPE